jgi:hypothetical protein
MRAEAAVMGFRGWRRIKFLFCNRAGSGRIELTQISHFNEQVITCKALIPREI